MSLVPGGTPGNADAILSDILRKARVYVPEWNPGNGEPDGGTALASLFAHLFGETADRLDQVPYKHFLSYLNLLDVSAQSMNPATGIAVFTPAAGTTEPVFVPKGTRLFRDLQDEGEDGGESRRIFFETDRDFVMTPAALLGFFAVDPKHDIIEQLPLAETPVTPFSPAGKANLQRHCFSLACDDVFRVESPAEIVLALENTALGYLNEENLTRLANPAFAAWSFSNGASRVPFASVSVRDGRLVLLKDDSLPALPFQQAIGAELDRPRQWITCEMVPDKNPNDIVMDRMSAGSASRRAEDGTGGLVPRLVQANDQSLDMEEGGYPFGKQPTVYDCLYIASDEAFSKRGARVHLAFGLKTVHRPIGADREAFTYSFNKRYIVEKADVQAVKPDRVFISRIVWEYWNGAGWSRLRVEGDSNPFDGAESQRRRQISFECPMDMTLSLQNAAESHWIRARVVEVENAFSLYADVCLPYLETLEIDYAYGDARRPVECVHAENNCRQTLFTSPSAAGGMMLYEPLRGTQRGAYLLFSQPPAGFPVHLYIRTEGIGRRGQPLRFEYLTRDVKNEPTWVEIKAVDGTDGLTADGTIALYAPRDFLQAELFGRTGHWVRMTDRADWRAEGETATPIVLDIVPNTVPIVQRQTVQKEMFPSGPYEAGRELVLINKPVLDCEVWVDELACLSSEERDRRMHDQPGTVMAEKDEAGRFRAFWVKWTSCSSFGSSDLQDRHYLLDRQNGRIRFGDGRRGRIPPAGDRDGIRVDYAFGGGKRGNLPAGDIEGLLVGLPFVDRATNLEMTCGGSDLHDIRTLERVGPQRIRHRGRAVTAADFENIARERFPEVRDARCFSHFDREGRRSPGSVTLVVMPYDLSDRRYSLSLCRRVESWLTERCCGLLAMEGLAVVPAVVLRLQAFLSMSVVEMDRAAETERQVLDAIAAFLDPAAAGPQRRRIGEIPAAEDFYRLLRPVGNIAGIEEVRLEGEYHDGRIRRLVPLGEDNGLKYAVAVNGTHIVRIHG